MLRKAIAGSTVSLMMASGLLVAAPVTTALAAPKYQDWGYAKSQNHVLKQGCHKYTYRYKIDAPRPYDVAAAEIFLVGPKGKNLASAAKVSNHNPIKAKAKFKLCRASVVYGKHTIKMKVTYKVGFETIEGWVRPDTFRFVRPRR